MQEGPPDDVSVSLGDVVVKDNSEIRHSRHDGGVRRLWVFTGFG